MRFVRFILLCALAMSSAGAQEPGSKLNAEPPLPKSPCRNDGHSFTARVARAPSIEELTRFDLSGLFGHRAYFRTGTLVSVSRREGQWSCVTGPFVASSGSSFLRTGWMQTTLLESIEQQDRDSGNRH